LVARAGRIEVITGSMFSGKSEELIRRVRRAQIARQRVQLFKPRLDARFSESEIVSHSEMKLPSQVVERATEIPTLVADDTEVVGIDEGQFFDASLVDVARPRQPGAARHRGRPRPGLPRPPVRAHAAAHGGGRVRGQDARGLHALRSAG